MDKSYLEYLGYHEKWHGPDINKRPITKFSINENIIDSIFKKLKIKKGNFVEFGAWDGIKNSNTRKLFLNGWSGLLIESNHHRFEQLLQNYYGQKNIFLSNSHIDENENLLDVEIQKTINDHIDFMSIDIDGLDIDIFDTIQQYLPTVICIEGGQILEPYFKLVGREISKRNVQQSLHQMNLKFKNKGYELICAYQDAIYIKKENYERLEIKQKDAFTHYVDGLLAYPRLPYINQILDEVNLVNRIISYILDPLNQQEIYKIALGGSIIEKSKWVDLNYPIIKSRANDLLTKRLEFPYDEHNETLWEEISNF